MQLMQRLACGTVALLAAGCLGSTESTLKQSLTFDMNIVGQGWVAGATGFPESQGALVDLVGELRPLPAPLSGQRNALYLKGTNPGGELFLFQKKYFEGLPANTTYAVSLEVEFATAYHGGCTTGPSPVTFIKVGASGLEPLISIDGQGVRHFSLNTGTGASAGDFVSGGDIRNELAGCPAPGTFGTRVTLIRNQQAPLVTDATGGIHLFVGTQSSFVGEHEIYILALRLTLEQQ